MSKTTDSNLISKNDSRTQFYEQANKHIKTLNPRYQEKAVITIDLQEKILHCLSNQYPEEFDARFKAWCRTTFVIQKTSTNTLLCDSTTHKPVIIYEQMYEIYKQTHLETAHGGRDKCLDNLSINYSWYNRNLLQLFIKNCKACQNRQPVKLPIISKPIIELEFMSRIQIDLIDMRTRPDANDNGKIYHWILQVKDHFSKFCWAKPLQHKEAHEVYICLREIFFLFGAPHILQSDNGREFVNQLINSLQSDFPGMHIVHGRPRHPQSQGLIERANAILTDALGKWMEDNSTHHWSDGLAPVIYSINTRTTYTTKKSPYELVFGQQPRTKMHYWKSLHDEALINDVQMHDLIIDKLEPIDKQKVSEETNASFESQQIEISSNLIDEKTSNIEEPTARSKPIEITTTNDDSRHELIRQKGRQNYLKAQQKRQEAYDDHIQKISESFKNGDLVGITINKVDRTNCDPKVMPCLIEKRSEKTPTPMYHLISPFGRLTTIFPVHQLIPMSGIQPEIVEKAKFNNLKTITLVQASKLFARGNPAATCDCKTKCRNKICPCRRASNPCSTKCHAKLGKCTNTEE